MANKTVKASLALKRKKESQARRGFIPRYKKILMRSKQIILVGAIFLFPLCLGSHTVSASTIYAQNLDSTGGVIASTCSANIVFCNTNVLQLVSGTPHFLNFYANIATSSSWTGICVLVNGSNGCYNVTRQLGFAFYSIDLTSPYFGTVPVLVAGATSTIFFEFAAGYGSGDPSYMYANSDLSQTVFVMSSDSSPFPPPYSVTTRFVSVYPSATTTATTTVNSLITGYINPLDFSSSTVVTIQYTRQDCTNIQDSGSVLGYFGQFINPACSFGTSTPVLSSGAFSLSSTVTFGFIGQYSYVASIGNISSTCYFGFCFGQNVSTSTQVSGTFIVGTSTPFDVLQNYVSSTTLANATVDLSSCQIWGSSGNVVDCIYNLIVPSASGLQATIQGFSGRFLTTWPLGYITDFISIMSSSSTVPLAVIDATLPSALPFAQGAHIHLDMTHAIDYILNATTSVYTNVSAPSTDTLYNITSYYWDIICGVLTLFYILGRVAGFSIIPHFDDRERQYDSNIIDIDRVGGKVYSEDRHVVTKRRK